MTKSSLLSPRPLNLLGFAACVGLMIAALALQYAQGLEPCPLCILQRVAVMLLGAVFLLAALHNPAAVGRRLYAAISLLIAATGAAIAGRHVWLQHLPPDQVPACGPGLEYMLQAFPMQKALSMVFTGSGECAKADWFFLGLSMPAWTLIWFAFLALGALWAGFRRR